MDSDLLIFLGFGILFILIHSIFLKFVKPSKNTSSENDSNSDSD
jgi:hypothetical protein